MLERVGVTEKKLEEYRGIVPDGILGELKELGNSLKNLRVCHISATPFGGGLPETIIAEVALEIGLGIKAEWYVLPRNERFFRTGKLIQDALQGLARDISNQDMALYLQYNRERAYRFDISAYDIVVVYNQHLLPLPHFYKNARTRWLWSCQFNAGSPYAPVWASLRSFVEEYHGAVFIMKEFIPPELRLPLIATYSPGIDPLSPKNRDLPRERCLDYVRSLGIDVTRPIVLHSSRLDQWKDPVQLFRCYYRAKDAIPGLQLVVTNSLVLDDPDSFSILRVMDTEAAKDSDIHVYTNMNGIGDIEVNAFQRTCTAGMLRAEREGFGLSVSETLWKERPVIGSRVGGITLQLTGELDCCLVDSLEDCTNKIIRLVSNKEKADRLGKAGREIVREHFLSPRLVRDKLATFQAIMR